jgi:NADH-quinone oxidoreductase subunit L
MTTYLILITIFLPWLGGLFVWLAGDRHPKTQHGLASGFSLAAGAASIALLFYHSDTVAIRIPMGTTFGEFTLIPDGLGVYLAAIAAVVGSLAVVFSINYMEHEEQLGRYYSIVLLFIGAMAGLVLSGSLLLMFLFWEITAFCSYALISFHNDDPKAVAGGIKALIVTQLGGIGLLAGALVVYAYFGSYQISALLAGAETLPTGVLNAIAFGFLAAAIAKSAQVPLHTWLPDAMEAPTPVTALIHAATMVNAGVYLLARFYPAFENVPGWTTSVVVVGMLSALLAAIMAVVANDLKRALAYSTISQLGYMVYSVGTGAVFASQFHLLSHSLFKALLFLSAGAVIHALGTRDMQRMGGLAKEMPFVRTVFIIGSLGLAGLPIANGFFSKELVLEGGFAHGPTWAYWCMAVGAGITALYTTRMIMLVFYGKPGEVRPAHDAPAAMSISLGALAFGTLTSWLLVGPFSQMLHKTLPFHEIHTLDIAAMVSEIARAPTTWIALLIIAIGIALWFLRRPLQGLIQAITPLTKFTQSGLGFDWMNTQIILGTKKVAAAFQATQTGQLSWNIVGIVGGLIILFAILAWGA